MKPWKSGVAAVTGGAVVSAAAAIAVGAVRWRRATAQAVARLNASAIASPEREFTPSEVALLPAPVQRYFTFALTLGQMLVRRSRIVQTGVFRAGGFDAIWSPFTAVQHFASHPPAFLWDARIRLAPFVAVQVRDSYIAGVGALLARIASLIPVMDQRGTRELALGALHRYLAEAAWLPTALLPSQGVVWDAVDDRAARATLTDGSLSVSLVFRFGDHGEILSAYTPERYRDVEGKSEMTPWVCNYGAYTPVNGMMIPKKGVAAWILPEGKLTYCKLHVLDMRFDDLQETGAPAAARGLVHLQEAMRTFPRMDRRPEQEEPTTRRRNALAGSANKFAHSPGSTASFTISRLSNRTTR